MPHEPKLTCHKGHPLSGANLYVYARQPNSRHCKLCQTTRARAWCAAKAAGLQVDRSAAVEAYRAVGASREDLAWAAGLFEGEGTIALAAGRIRGVFLYSHLRISVTSTDREVVEYFQARWPAKRITERDPGGAARLAYVWALAARKATAFLRDVQPFFRTTRVQTKAALALRVEAGRRVGSRDANYRAAHMAYVEEMHVLNRRGRTIGEVIVPRIAEAVSAGRLLPEHGSGE